MHTITGPPRIPAPLRMTGVLPAILSVLLGVIPFLEPAPAAAQNTHGVWAERGMVVSQNPEATRVGREVLEEGGNAVDAAVAVSLALGVTEQYHSGIGGGGFILIYQASGAAVTAIDAREKAPASARRDMFAGPENRGKSEEGALAVGVPGLLAGLDTALEQHGTMELAELIEPSIRLAGDGFRIGYYYSRKIEEKKEKLQRHPESARIYLRDDGSAPPPDHLLVQKDLACTYGKIAEEGTRYFYRGELAGVIADFMKEQRGLITREDLASYAPVVRKPVRGTYRDVTVYSMPPPSSGGIHLVQMLNVLEGFDVKDLGFGSSRYLHTLAETMKWAFRDRAAFLGDPEFFPVPLGRLTSKKYAAGFRERIDPDTALVLEAHAPRPGGGTHTSHLSVLDRWGNAVAITQTVNLDFGSGLTVPGTGIVLNDEMDDFAAEPGVANFFGLVGSEANAAAPGKRPLSSMTPTIVTKDGKVFMVLGSPGGPRIITSVLQVLVNVIDFGMPLGDAVAAPRVHHQWNPDALFYERRGLAPEVIEELQRYGHTVKPRGSCGAVHAIMADQETGYVFGAADRRLEGSAAGY